MRNFNTNQTRQFYVAGAVDSSLDTALDIALGATQSGELFFKYVNADGIQTRSETFKIANITSLKKTAASKMATPLKAHTLAIDTNVVTLSSLIGKTLDCIITIHQFGDYDDSTTRTFVASVVGNSTNTATASAFHKALAEAIALALPRPVEKYPLIKVFSNGSEVTPAIAKAGSAVGAAGGVVLVEGIQKYVRGKLTGEPCPFSVTFRLKDGNLGDIVWGTETIEASAIAGNTVVPANYILADLEYFALGERGDMFRGYAFPDNYEPTYAINPFGATQYDVLTVEYFWAGDAENVQKSPRIIQVAGAVTVTGSGSGATSSSPVDTLYEAIKAYMDGTAGSGSGSGSGSAAQGSGSSI